MELVEYMFDVSSICSCNMAQKNRKILHHSLKSRSFKAFNICLNRSFEVFDALGVSSLNFVFNSILKK